MLSGDVPPKRVAKLARERGIDFQITPEIEKELRAAGGTDDLLIALREIAPHPGSKVPRQPAALMIQSTPGGAQVYVDGEFEGTTSSQGKLKIAVSEPGQHRIRLSLQGYRDREELLNLSEGTITAFVGNLDGVPPKATEGPLTGISPRVPDVNPLAPQQSKSYLLKHAYYGGKAQLNPLHFGPTFHEGTLAVYSGRIEWSEVANPRDDFVARCSDVAAAAAEGDKSLRIKLSRKDYLFASDRGEAKTAVETIQKVCPSIPD